MTRRLHNIEVEHDGAYIGATEIPLTAFELKVLNRLVLDPGQLVAIHDLHAALYGHAGNATGSNVLQVTIGRLRKKLTAAGAQVRIDNVRGLGYALQLVDDSAEATSA